MTQTQRQTGKLEGFIVNKKALVIFWVKAVGMGKMEVGWLKMGPLMWLLGNVFGPLADPDLETGKLAVTGEVPIALGWLLQRLCFGSWTSCCRNCWSRLHYTFDYEKVSSVTSRNRPSGMHCILQCHCFWWEVSTYCFSIEGNIFFIWLPLIFFLLFSFYPSSSYVWHDVSKWG